MNYDVTASIVTYHTDIGQLRKAVDNFISVSLKIRLWIIDNSSTEELQKHFKDPRIEYLNNNRNVGFGSGHNIALRKNISQSKYHLVLNPDVYFEKGTIEQIYKYMEAHEDIGSIMPKVLYPDGSIQYLCKLLPTPIDLILRRFSFQRFNKIRNEVYELRISGYNSIMDVPCLSGCFMFIRTEAIKRAGFFDERFFMYLEDMDLSRRINKHYRTVYFPEVSVYHNYEKGSYKNWNLLRYHIDSAVKYFNKWGWLFDKERREINNKIIESVRNLVTTPVNGQ